MRYTVASVDAIANGGCWEVNDLTQIGVIDLDANAIDDDQLILDILNEVGYTDNLTVDDTEIGGDDDLLMLIDSESGRPLYQLILDGIE